MSPGRPLEVVRWSTQAVPAAQRFEYFSEALSSALIPMHAACDTPLLLQTDIESVTLEGLTVIRQVGTAHRSFRRATDLRRDLVHTYHLIVNLATEWTIEHRTRLQLRPGDAVLTDSRFGHEIDIHHDFDVIHLKLEEDWVHRWLPDPRMLVGRVIPRDAGWGHALASFASALSPQWVSTAPIAPRLVADQLGALLSLIGAQVGDSACKPSAAESALREKIKACIALRCTDPLLDVDAVAAALRQPAMTVERTLLAFGESFQAVLVSARVDSAVRMLESRTFRSIGVEEIAARAGFSGTAAMSRAVRRLHGRTPAEIRRDDF